MGTISTRNQTRTVNDIPLFVFKPYEFTVCDSRGQFAPKPRSGHRIVCDDANLYTYGGYNPGLEDRDMQFDTSWLQSKPLFREVWKYNYARQKWQRMDIENIPLVLASNAVALQGKILMVYGGTGVPFGGHCSNELFICDLKLPILRFDLVVVSGNKPEPQYGQAIFLKDSYMYVIGGTTGYEYSADVHRLDMRTGVWECKYSCVGNLDEPVGRYRHELGFDGEKIYILGGGTADEAFGFEILPVFDISTSKWLHISTCGDPMVEPQYPVERRFHSCVQIPKKNVVIIIGGYNGSDILNDTWSLDLETLQWKKIIELTLPSPMYFHSSAISPSGKMYTFGGIIEKGKETYRTSTVFSTWVCIPKLKEICWEAVLYYSRTFKLTLSGMRSCGYPEEFVLRAL